jgi:hypothetical protein
MKCFQRAPLLLAFSLLVPSAFGDTRPAPVLMPPSPPRHEQRMLDNASDLARDLAEIVAFLEAGQSYFRAYKKGTHTREENAAMVKFLETYEKEREIAKKEAELLHTWIKTRSDLEPVEDKLDDKRGRQ